MSSPKQTVINPKTNRPIVVGGRVYMKLLREGLIENPNIKDDNILFAVERYINTKLFSIIGYNINELNNHRSKNQCNHKSKKLMNYLNHYH